LWERCWSTARVYLGLSTDAFLRLTPRQFYLLLDRYHERVQHLELLAGIVTANIVNHSMGAPRKRAVPSDFMPSRLLGKQPRERINRREVANQVRAFFDRAIKIQQANGITSNG